jgi:hypothetical protein
MTETMGIIPEADCGYPGPIRMPAPVTIPDAGKAGSGMTMLRSRTILR